MTTTNKTFISLTLLTVILAGMLFFTAPHKANAATDSAPSSSNSSILILKPAHVGTGKAEFVPLTNFPLFSNGASSRGISIFLNQLYQYVIGIAIILAVLEVVWGGFLWMGSGASVTSKEAGKSKIGMALAGLLLVLSPYLVFQIINPRATSLKLGSQIHLTSPPLKSTESFSKRPSYCSSVCTVSGTILEKGACPVTDSCTYSDAGSWLGKWLNKTNCPKGNEVSWCLDTVGCTTVVASCSPITGGPFTMVDTSAFFNPLNNYVPLKSEGNGAVDFTNGCIKDGGEYCAAGAPKTACPPGTPEKWSGKCATVTIYCKPDEGRGRVSSCSVTPLDKPI